MTPDEVIAKLSEFTPEEAVILQRIVDDGETDLASLRAAVIANDAVLEAALDAFPDKEQPARRFVERTMKRAIDAGLFAESPRGFAWDLSPEARSVEVPFGPV
jgi:hypothetical protein